MDIEKLASGVREKINADSKAMKMLEPLIQAGWRKVSVDTARAVVSEEQGVPFGCERTLRLEYSA